MAALLKSCADGEFWNGVAVSAGLLILSLSLALLFPFWRGLVSCTRAENRPASFTYRILPFFLPLFFLLSLAAVAFANLPFQTGLSRGLLFWGTLPYFLWATPVLMLGGPAELALAVPLAASALTALSGAAYMTAKTAPPAPRARGWAIHLGLTLLLGALAGGAYEWSHLNLFTSSSSVPTVQDETDLTPYRPFAKTNLLVKIASPALTIDADHPRLHGALGVYPVYAAAAEAIYKNAGREKIEGGTSPKAFASLLANESDMVFMLTPSREQLDEAERLGRKLTVTPIGHEAFVFFVSRTNPVDDLTADQIRGIYAKRTTRWSEVGGTRKRILPFQRPEGSGSQTMMRRFMGDVPLAKPMREEYQEMMGGIVNRVADYRNYGHAIGFSFRYYVESLFKHDGVKLLKIGGVAPTLENIQSGAYPLIGQVVIVTAGSANPNVPKLTDWFLSPQGQELVERVGYVPLASRKAE
ncbi:MAG: substrate-binding domain-containing protein [Verrucomicrobiota bacterium]|nr:substrate-binding domain-containing protein [Verrucomicrobiota bacterium]